MRVDDADVINGAFFIKLTVLLLIIVIGVFFVGKKTENNPFLSPTEICQKHFGRDYVYQDGYYGASFCVDSSGVPKYPKTWEERRSNARTRIQSLG